jgi:ABC-type branched-subunit amino acid transport system substrate-binding protein
MRAAIEGPGASSNVELVVVDDGGDPALAAIGMRSLEDATVLGVVGPLEDHVLEAASGARRRVLPIISPTALGSTGEGGVFSLGGADPGAAHALAEYAAGSDLRYVVVIHPDEPGARFEAQVFREAFEELRGSVLRILTYPPGATYFEEQLRQAEALSPQALVLPVPPRDIEALAPQVSFFGLDTLGIKILGTAGWADENVLRNVSPRHTSGVVLATPQQPGPDAPGYRRFVDAYEARFQRSLRDDIPALGYDAASLILLAVNLGASSPGDVQRALERIQNFEGATGVLSVRNGHVIRAHNLVCIQDRALVEVRTGEATLHYRPMREGDRDLGEPERVPAGPLEIYCPGMAPPGLRVPVG